MSTATPSADEQAHHAGPRAIVAMPQPRSGRAVLVMQIGGRAGPTFLLDATRDNILGRSGDIDIALADRLASRRHASIRYLDGAWLLEDLRSRNGTSLDGRLISRERLHDGAVIRVGLTELSFRLIADLPGFSGDDITRLVRCGPVDQLQGDVLRRPEALASQDSRRGVVLYQASLRLLASRSAREVTCAVIELVIEHTAVSGVGWFRIVEAGSLDPLCVVPPGGNVAAVLAKPVIREIIERLVATEGQAVWLQPGTAVEPHEDVLCLPLLDGSRPHAALVAMAPQQRFQESDFDMLIGLVSLASAAWAGHAAAAASSGNRGSSRAAADLASLTTIDLDATRVASNSTPAAGAEDKHRINRHEVSRDFESHASRTT